MKPIISPFMFYLIHLSENLMIFCLFFAAGFGIYAFVKGIDGEPIKKPLIAFIISIAIAMFTPCREVCYQMMIASMATPDNIEIVGNTAENLIDYIVESVDTLLEESK